MEINNLDNLGPGSIFNRSQASHWQHFGLGAQGGRLQLLVRWPSGNVSHHQVAVDRRWVIREQTSLPAPSEAAGDQAQHRD